MRSNKGRKVLILIRDGVVILAVTVAIFIVAEFAIRLLAPQDVETTFVGDKSIALEDEVLGHVYRPGAQAKVRGPEFSAEYKINQQGLRDESDHPDPKPDDVTRILILGDSFTFGEGNAYDKIWPVVFERRMLEQGYSVDVVKAGVSGYDTRKELLYLKRLFPKYRPDVVVLTFLPNDLFTNTPIRADELADTATPTSADNVVARARKDKATKLHLVTFAKRLLLPKDYLYTRLYAMTARSEYFTMPMSARLERQVAITKDILAAANNYCREKGVAFVVWSLPQQYQVLMKANDFQADEVDVDYIDEIFTEFADENGFDWIPALSNLVDEYRSNKKNLYFRFDGHLNNSGNDVVGSYLSTQFIGLFGDALEKSRADG